MNLKQIAQKLGGYIQSKTQDDEGWVRQNKFTPIKAIQDIGQSIGQKKLASGITLKQLPSAYMQSFSQSRTLPEKLMNIGTSSFLKAASFGLLQPQAPKAETGLEKFYSRLGGLTGFVGPGAVGMKAMGGVEKLGQAGIMKFAPKLQTTLAGKIAGGLSKEAAQTAAYLGGKYLAGKAGLKPDEKITGKSILTDLAIGAAMRGITTPGAIGMVSKAISPDVWTSDRSTLNEALQRLKVGETIDEFSETGKALKNMYKEYGLASYPNWNKLSQSQQVNVLSERLDEMARSGFNIKMGITDQPIKTGTKYKTINEGGIIKEVEGKPIKLVNGVETFIHQGDNPKRTVKGFIISEKSTGRYLATGETESEAIRNAKNLVNSVGEDGLKQKLLQVGPIKTGETIKLKDNDLVKTFDETIKTTETPKIKISNLDNTSDIQGNGINQDVQIPIQKKTIKIKPIEQPSVLPQDSLSQGPYLDSKGELQFPGIENTKNIFNKPELDISQVGKDKGSILGGDGFKASPEVKQTFATWVNSRRASQIEGILKGKEFKDLDSKGIDGIFEFQSGNKTGRYTDIKKYFDDKFSDLNTKGVNINYKQDYLPQMWNNSTAEVQQVFGNRLGLKPSFTLDSIIKNYQEGIEAGLTPKYTKVSDLIASYEARANKSLADRQFFDEVKKANIILPANKAPLDWVTLDPDRFPRLSFTTDEGKYTGVYKAPADIGTMINNYLANPSTSPNVFLKGLNSVANWTSSVKNRVLSFGIPGTAINAHGFNILARNVMSSKNPIEGAITGIKYMLDPQTAVAELDRQLTQFGPEAVKNGLTLSANEFKSVLEAPVGIKSKIGATWDKLFERGLFDRMLPTLKLQKYKEIYDGFIKGGMNKSEAGRAAAKFTNDVFGGINMEELGKSRDMQNLLRVTVLAPDWMQTNINLARKLPTSVIKLSNKSYAPYRKFLATFIGTYITMNVVNKLSSGHWMYENDSGNSFNIEAGYTADGQKRYIRPFGTAADFIRIPADVLTSLLKGDIQAPVRVIRNRLSIPLGVGLGAITDTDYTGNPIGYKGKDKWGNEIPVGQRALGVGGELATLAGMPAFAKQGLDYVSGKTKLEPALLQGTELPFRYSGGAYSKTQQKITGLLQEQGVTGKELYDANESIKGLSFSDKDMEKIKTGGLPTFNQLVKSKQTSAKLNAELKGTGYATSEDAPKNLISKIFTYGKAVITDPKATLDAVVAGNPVRKVENGYVVLERSQGLGQIDKGNKATQVDHITPLEFGGKNPSKNSAEILAETKGMTSEQKVTYLKEQNLEELPIEQHKIKTAVQAELSKKLSAGEITKQDAKRMLENWRDNLSLLTPKIKEALASELSVSDTVAEITDGKTYTITNEAGNDKEYDITTPIIKPTATGLTEVDKLNFSKYNSAITTRKNDIKKVLDSGQITPEQAEILLSDLKKKSNGSGNGKSKSKKKITFKVTSPKALPKITLKISSPVSRVKLKSAPKIKLSKTDNRKYTIKA